MAKNGIGDNMQKYVRKGFLELHKEDKLSIDDIKEHIFEAEVVDEDKKVQSRDGEILVTKGNFIMTGTDGSQFGVTPQDLENQYDKV